MFLYENKDAVGQCQSCGKGLCKDCLTEYNGICQDCYFDNKAEQIDGDNQNMVVALTEYKRNIISTLVKGGIGSALLGIVAAMLVPLSSLSFMEIIEAFMLAFIPMGFFTITAVLGKDPDRGVKRAVSIFGLGSNNSAAQGFAIGYFLTRFIIFVIKIVICYFIGIPCVIYLIVKLVSVNKKLVNLESNYKAQVDDFVKEMESKGLQKK